MEPKAALAPVRAALILMSLLSLAGCLREPAGLPTDGITLVVGTYTSGGDDSDIAESRGLYALQLDPETGQLEAPRLLAELENPSYAAVDAVNQRLYVVSEAGQGEVVAYQWQQGQRARLINRVTAGGSSPCYIAISPMGNQLAVANYMTGNIAVYDLDVATGAISKGFQMRQHSGRGPNSRRQEAAHAHWVQWDPTGGFLYVVDLGIDKVMGYPVNRATGALGEAFVALETSPGAGPRHMVFHPRLPLAYLLNELDNSLVLAGRNPDGTLMPLQRVDTLPDDFDAHSQAAHIAIDAEGRHLYVSNRGHDSIATFPLGDNGKLGSPQWVSTGGDWPRHFSLLEDQGLLVVANQNSNNLRLFQLNAAGVPELLEPRARVAQPTFVGPFAVASP